MDSMGVYGRLGALILCWGTVHTGRLVTDTVDSLETVALALADVELFVQLVRG